MKKTIQVVSIVALTSLAVNGVRSGQATPATTATPAQATVLTGTVTSVDAKAGTLTVKVKDKEIHLTTDSKSTKAALEKLKVGDTAKVFEKGGTVIAASPAKADSEAKSAK